MKLARGIAALAALMLCAAPVAAGPSVPCPDGPNPLRFRPELPIAPVAFAPWFEGWVVDVAAAIDPSDGREWIAVAWRAPDLRIHAAVSGDGGLTFGAGGGGFGPVAVDSAGGPATSPQVALRVDGGLPLLAIAWNESDALRVATATDWSGSFRTAVLEPSGLESRALDVAVAPAPASRRVFVAWMADVPDRALRVVTNAADGDPLAWSAPLDVASPGGDAYGPILPDIVMRQLAMSADAAGAGGSAGASLLAITATGRAFLARSDDAGASFGAWRVVDDGSVDLWRHVEIASQPGVTSAWTAIALWGDETPGDLGHFVKADAALVSAGAVVADFEGVGATSAEQSGPVGATAPVGVAIGASPTETTLFATGNGVGDIDLSRRALSLAGPRVSGGCGPVRVTGLDPPRSGGYAFSSQLASLAADVVIAFLDFRSGASELWLKRSDASAPAIATLSATPAPCGSAPAIRLRWPPLPPDVVDVEVQVGSIPGGTDFTRPAPPGGEYDLEGLDPGRDYYLRVGASDLAGHLAFSPEVLATTPACSTARLRSSVVAVNDACPTGGAGGDGHADPGEILGLRVRVENAGTGVASGSSLRVLSRAPEVHAIASSHAAGDLLPGESVEIDAEVHVSATAGCLTSLRLLLETSGSSAAWADLAELPRIPACTPCSSSSCSIVADASRSAPANPCGRQTVVLDGTGTMESGCNGVVLWRWSASGVPLGAGQSLAISSDETTTYRLEAACSTDLACVSSDDVTITVSPGPSPPSDLRLARNASRQLEFSWTPVAGARARVRSSLDARDLVGPATLGECEGAGACIARMTNGPLEFFTAVSLCADGIGEGPP